MNIEEIYSCYCKHLKEISPDTIPAPIESLCDHPIFTRDSGETTDTFCGEIYYIVCDYSDKLYSFIFAERTSWRKNQLGDPGDTIEESYFLVDRT